MQPVFKRHSLAFDLFEIDALVNYHRQLHQLGRLVRRDPEVEPAPASAAVDSESRHENREHQYNVDRVKRNVDLFERAVVEKRKDDAEHDAYGQTGELDHHLPLAVVQVLVVLGAAEVDETYRRDSQNGRQKKVVELLKVVYAFAMVY